MLHRVAGVAEAGARLRTTLGTRARGILANSVAGHFVRTFFLASFFFRSDKRKETGQPNDTNTSR